MKGIVINIFVLFCFIIGQAQTIQIKSDSNTHSLLSIITSFEASYQLNFSYDVDVVKNMYLTIEKDTLSISELLDLLDKQTSYQILQEGEKDFLLLKKAETTTDICGTVVDILSTYELSNAEIILNGKIQAITDNNGFFEFETKASPSDSIIISYLGYENKIKTINEFNAKKCDTIRLTLDIQELNSVVLKDYLTTGVEKNADGSVLFSTKKLKILPGLVEPDVFTGLQALPGISSPTEDAAALYIRGGTPDQNLVLFDGIKMYQTGHFFDQISGFNPNIIGTTNVYRGGTSVRYGDRLSGVIDISTDDNLLDSQVIGGGINLTHGDVFIKTPLSKNTGFLASFRRSTTDFYDNIVTANLIEKVFQNTRAGTEINDDRSLDVKEKEDKTLFMDTNFKFLWNINRKNSLKFSGIFIENRLNSFRIDDFDPRRAPSRFSDLLKTRNLGGSIQWKKTGDSGVIQNSTLYVSYYDQRYNVTREVETEIFRLRSNNIVNDFGMEYSLQFPIGKKKKIHFGYQMVQNKTYHLLDSKAPDPDEDINNFTDRIRGKGINYTFFSEYRYGNSKTFYTLGLRNSYLSNISKLFLEPRAYISSEVFKNFRITSSIELKNQQLNRLTNPFHLNSQIPSLPISKDIWLVSNSTFNSEDSFGSSAEELILPVIKSSQFTLGALWSHRGWNFDVEGYYKKIRDIGTLNNIIFDIATLEVEDELEEDIFSPIGTEDRIGIDFLAKKTFRNYRFWLGYTLSSTFINFPGLQAESFPNASDQRHVLNISQTLKVQNFEFALGWRYASGAPFTKLIPVEDDFLQVEIDPKGLNASRFPDYHRLDFSLLYRLTSLKNGISIVVGSSIRNLYNRKNVISQRYVVQPPDDEFSFESLNTFENQSLALTPDVVFRITF